MVQHELDDGCMNSIVDLTTTSSTPTDLTTTFTAVSLGITIDIVPGGYRQHPYPGGLGTKVWGYKTTTTFTATGAS